MWKVFAILFWLIIWEIAALCIDNALLLVTPVEALSRLCELALTESFWQTVLTSLGRIALGFVMGSVAALILAALAYLYKPVEMLLHPAMTVCKSVPVASFVVILLIWWGSSYLATAICFLVVLPNLYLNTLEGLKATDQKLLEMAWVLRLPLRTRMFYLFLPALRPFLLSAFELSLGMCWKSGVAAEVIGTPRYSIGGALYLSKISLDTAGIFAWTAAVVVLCVLLEKLVLWGLAHFLSWEPKCGKPLSLAWPRGGSQHSGLMDESSIAKESEAREGVTQNLAEACRGVLHVQDLMKTFDDRILFEHRNATYLPGETTYLTTPSGSGKTTYLNILCGLEEADDGRIDGATSFSVQFQEDRLCEGVSAVRNVEMVTGDRASARSALQQLLPDSILDKPCGTLSGGEKRRVSLVRAMEADSEVVLLDEPFTGMDAETKNRAMTYLRDRQRGRILIIATHEEIGGKAPQFPRSIVAGEQ